jgi:hypothetical protein
MDAVQETFVDALGEISFKHGMIRIELLSLSGPEPRVAQRLITSLQAFTQMLQAQSGMLEQLEKAGVLRGIGAGLTRVAPAQGGEDQPASEAPEKTEPSSTQEDGQKISLGGAVRRLLRVEPGPSPAALQERSKEPEPLRAETRPPSSPNFSQG